jgi:hypothetical protein
MTDQTNINVEIRKRKFGWIRHTLSKDDSELCKAVLLWNPQGTRGKAKKYMANNYRNECGKCSWNDLWFIARDGEYL